MLMLILPSSKHHAVGCKNQKSNSRTSVSEPADVRVSYPAVRKQKMRKIGGNS